MSKLIPFAMQLNALKENLYGLLCQGQIDHFTVVCLVARPLNEYEAGGDLVLIETSLLFSCKFVLINMRTALLT